MRSQFYLKARQIFQPVSRPVEQVHYFEGWGVGAKSTFCKVLSCIQARIAQLEAYRLGTGVVPGSNPGKGENFSVKIMIKIGLSIVLDYLMYIFT